MRNPCNRSARTVCLFAATVLLSAGCAASDESTGDAPPAMSAAAPATTSPARTDAAGSTTAATSADTLYSSECSEAADGSTTCVVDKETFKGWRTYHAFCHVCHAQDAVGSTFAPSLLDRMNESDMTFELFEDRVANGFTGQVGVMPPWKENPNVSKYYAELYAYLMARASGDLKPGRPQKQ